jgi:hypothetical protein
MRLLFLLLLLANLGFFAWSRYLAPADAGVDPAPLGRQIAPEKLRVLRPGEAPRASLKPPASAAAPAAPSPVPAPVSGAPAAPAVPAAASAAAPASPASCLEWGSFTLADAPKAEKALEPLSLGGRIAQRHTEEMAGWWVFIPPQGNRQLALNKAAQLKALGVTDYFIVTEDSPLRWALSLGVFRTQEAAQARLLTLNDQGVRSARVGARETIVPKVWLQVKGVDPALEGRLKEMSRQIEGSELKPCS